MAAEVIEAMVRTRSARDDEWEAEDRRNQVAFWARESTRGHDRVSSQGVCVQENQDGSGHNESPDENVSSLHNNDDGEIDDGPETSSVPKKNTSVQREDAEVLQSSVFHAVPREELEAT
ncbi:hypothetical protein GGI43DRAFT_387078 [Trichoderma evansii]